MSLFSALNRIERWLAANAPATFRALKPAATPQDLEHVEAVTRLRVLPDVKRLYFWHNGGGGPDKAMWLAPDFGLMSLDQAVERWHIERDVAGANSVQTRWFPICTAFTGDFIAVDHAADSLGAVFPVLRGDGAVRERGWETLSGLVEEIATAVEEARAVRGRVPFVGADGALQWGHERGG